MRFIIILQMIFHGREKYLFHECDAVAHVDSELFAGGQSEKCAEGVYDTLLVGNVIAFIRKKD